MDEPLSNLDAKLRVTTRTQIAALVKRLGTTTVYVTHDQVEAMTMGDRVAVLKDGVLQQCDSPSVLYDRPANAFVAGFIGSPAMNLVTGDRVDGGRPARRGRPAGAPQPSWRAPPHGSGRVTRRLPARVGAARRRRARGCRSWSTSSSSSAPTPTSTPSSAGQPRRRARPLRRGRAHRAAGRARPRRAALPARARGRAARVLDRPPPCASPSPAVPSRSSRGPAVRPARTSALPTPASGDP